MKYFKRSLTLYGDDAAELGRVLTAFASGEFGGADVSHVWRVGELVQVVTDDELRGACRGFAGSIGDEAKRRPGEAIAIEGEGCEIWLMLSGVLEAALRSSGSRPGDRLWLLKVHRRVKAKVDASCGEELQRQAELRGEKVIGQKFARRGTIWPT